MEELDLLKKDWKRSENAYTQVPESELYKMTHRSSSSIVKWLLVISIIEFTFWGVITLFFGDDKYDAKLQRYGLVEAMFWVNTINYVFLVAFIFLFYRNYRRISITDSTHRLMQNILATRRTVQYYIWYNLAIVLINVVLNAFIVLNHNANVMVMLDQATTEGHRGLFLFKYSCMWVGIIVVLFGLFWLFYRLLYGILLRKLFANYRELRKSEV